MHTSYKNIRVIGFDLDHTLYPKSPEIDRIIQDYIFKKIAEHKKVSYPEGKKLFTDLYKDGDGLSGRATLVALGLPNATEIIQESLENADVASVLSPDKEVLQVLETLKKIYTHLDIITGSNRAQTEKKIEALGIPITFFAHVITDEVATKSDKSAFIHWMRQYPNLQPNQFLYIGDREGTDHKIPSSLKIQTILVNVSEQKSEIDTVQLQNFKDVSKILTKKGEHTDARN